MVFSNARFLLVEPSKADAEEITTLLTKNGAAVERVSTTDEALRLIRRLRFEVVITDYEPGPLKGDLWVMELVKELPRLPIIVTTRKSTSEIAIRAVKSGAFDFFLKPIDAPEFSASVEQALEATRRMSKPVDIGGASFRAEQDSLIGQSRAMTGVYKELGRLSATPVTVLIRGETGTGKELIARALYQHGHRAHKPFITVNCAAIPENLLESELFGHERGAFTGAVQTRIGKFEQAHGATLFLDEIGDLDLALQAKLLRVLQERQIQRVGGREDIPVDVRIIAATHRNLEAMVANGDFRIDLFYRFNVAAITLPPLRKRREDIALLTDYFLKQYGAEMNVTEPAITTRAVRFLEEQPWPGNVRQLQNVLRKALLKSRGYAIDRTMIRDVLQESEQPTQYATAGGGVRDLVMNSLTRARDGESPDGAYKETIEAVEKELLGEAMGMSDNNISKAAGWLGISRLTLRRKLVSLGLREDESGSDEED